MFDHSSGPATVQRAARRHWIGLAVLALPTLLIALDMSVLYLALPHLSADLHAGPTQQLWILDIYGFMVAGFLVTMGTLGDRIGRRKLLLIGAGAFTLASLAAAYATSAELLIVARALLGIAGATLMPSTLALISNMFRDARQRAVAIAVWMSCFMVGTAVGPVIGGVLLEWFWWGSVFLLGVPVMVVLLVAGPLLLPEYRDPAAARLDLPSVALSLAAILPAVYGLKELAQEGVQLTPVAVLAVGAAFGVAFVRRQRRLTNPLVDLRLFVNPTFRATLVIAFITAMLMGGTFLYIPLYLQTVEGLSPLNAGIWMVPQAVAMIISTQLAPRFARRFRPAYVMAAGLAVAATGCLLITQVDPVGGLPLVVIGFLLACVGVAPPAALGTDLIVGSAPVEKAGSAASISETSNELGIAIGVAVLGSVGTSVYRSLVGGAVPAGVPGAAADVARESVAGATAVAGELPAGLAADLMEVARESFTVGLNTVAVVGVVLFAGLAVLAARMLRRIEPTGAAPAPIDEPSTDEPSASESSTDELSADEPSVGESSVGESSVDEPAEAVAVG